MTIIPLYYEVYYEYTQPTYCNSYAIDVVYMTTRFLAELSDQIGISNCLEYIVHNHLAYAGAVEGLRGRWTMVPVNRRCV